MKMQSSIFHIMILLTISLSASHAKIMRNNALMTKMISKFHQNNDVSEPEKESQPVLFRMQNVLCKNFPTIPCEMITEDKTLKKLIEKSIQQINYKKLSLEKTTPFPGYLTLFPTLNNENLSNFIQVNDNNYTHEEKKQNQKRRESAKAREKKIQEKRKKIKNKTKRTSFYSRNKLRKFYPHKVKYRDKNNVNKNIRNVKDDFGDNSAEKLSMSVEVPDMTLTRKHQHFAYKVEPENPPVWRIDYMKHGEPSFNMFGYEVDRFNGKIMNNGPNVVGNGNEHPRQDVLHPDVYIKKNFVRKNNDVNSDGVE